MKKAFRKIATGLAAMMLAAIAFTTFAACSSRSEDDDKIKISLAQFNEDGIVSINLYYLGYADYEAIEVENEKIREDNQKLLHDAGVENYEDLNEEQRNQVDNFWQNEKYFYSSNKLRNCYLYNGYNDLTGVVTNGTYTSAELDKGSYFLVVAFKVGEVYTLNRGDMQVEVNGKEYPLYSLGLKEGQLRNEDSFAMIEQRIDSDTKITITGKTNVKSYNPIEYKNTPVPNSIYSDLMFKVAVDGKPITYNGNEEIAVADLKEAIDASSTTQLQKYKLTCYFKDKAKFFPSNEVINKFFGQYAVLKSSKDLQLEWEHENYYDKKISLDFHAFDGYTNDDLSKIKVRCDGSIGEIYEFIVNDGTAQPMLTLADYRDAENVKIKLQPSIDIKNLWDEKSDDEVMFKPESAVDAPGVLKKDVEITDEYIIINIGGYKSYKYQTENTAYSYLTISLYRNYF